MFKRVLDILAAIIGLVLFSPVLVLVGILLAFQNNGQVFFIQKRPGLNQKPFNIVKFKSMNDRRDSDGNLLPDDQRITVVGRVVRKLSLDEVPQLVNVFKGDMSLIGPRPLLFKYIPLYSTSQLRRHEVRPGITGWAQVNGRNAISWTKKFELDVEYVDNLTFRLDFQIFFLTILKIIKREGIYQTNPGPFDGTN
jgi:lipopolysaccharide/colanic/teichoic acid biosynthesis glycosyltransferase